jgi:hypothetical protein
MSVTFGTLVPSNGGGYIEAQSLVFPMTVVSGQPIFLAIYSFGAFAPTFTDTFGTSYTYTLVPGTNVNGGGPFISLYIATGGSGATGTITSSAAGGSVFAQGIAVPCVGASAASGTAALDVHGNSSGNSTAPAISMTPTAASEGAVAMELGGTLSSFGSPGAPWVSTVVGQANSTGLATYASPPNGVAATCTWTAASGAWVAAGAIVKSNIVPFTSFAPLAGWQSVLNTLAGTSNLGENAAANRYAGTSNLGLLAALNAKAGTTNLGLDAVCNKIAGTTGLSALGALNVKAGL